MHLHPHEEVRHGGRPARERFAARRTRARAIGRLLRHESKEGFGGGVSRDEAFLGVGGTTRVFW
jgi:hypothetical protein